MKRDKRHIIYTWLVLFCFLAGQIVVYTHRHFSGAVYSSHKTSTHQTTVTDKCQLCDAMHHNSMVIDTHHYTEPVVTSTYLYKQGKYDFVSISLILSSGRAPPIS
ncbi:MAG: hypothetical protein ACTHJ8_14975 [Mucilaginibacter sp.]